MILHTFFFDGSNDWVSLPTDRHEIAKHWRRWKKYHPDACVVARCGRFACYQANNGVYIVTDDKKYPTITKLYKHLGHALAALERLEKQ